MDKFLQTITDSVGTQLQGMSTTISKMKQEGEDRYKQINERIANMEKKISAMDENVTHDDQNQGKAVATGLHGETSESEVEQPLRETITGIGMSNENARIECLAKPITHAFINFKNDDERNTYVRSANMLRKELRGEEDKDDSINGRRRKISSEKTGTAFTWDMQFLSTWFPWTGRQSTCQSKARLCGKNMSKWIPQVYQVPRHWTWGWRTNEKWQSKNSSERLWAVERWDRDAGVKERLRVVTSSRQCKETKDVTDVQVKEAAGKSSTKLAETFQFAWGVKKRQWKQNEKKWRFERKRRRQTQTLQCWRRRATVFAKLRGRKQRQQQQQKRQRRQDGERKQRFEQQEEWQQKQNDKQ